MSLIWNNKISVSYFGEAHDSVIGVTINGIPEGEYISSEKITGFLSRLSPKSLGTAKKLPSPRIMSGLMNERTTGAPLCAILQNTKVQLSSDENTESLRFGHGDYTGTVCCRGYCDAERKSRSAEIFTTPLCFAGAVCGQILERRGIYTGGHIARIHNIKDNPFDTVRLSRDAVLSVRFKDLPVINDRIGWTMLENISMARESGESLGGIVECVSVNVPSGVGSPIFNGLTNCISQLLFTLPDITGVEFGDGFSAAEMPGSQYADISYITEQGYSMTKTNSHGGMINGISSGMPITVKAAFKPPKIGSSECCTIPQAVIYAESAINIALLTAMLDYPNFC